MADRRGPVRHEVAVQIQLRRQTGPGNSLVRDQPSDGLIDDARGSGIAIPVVLLMAHWHCLEAVVRTFAVES